MSTTTPDRPRPRPIERCPDCTTPGGYCAPNRCYCGHRSCPAYRPPIARPTKETRP